MAKSKKTEEESVFINSAFIRDDPKKVCSISPAFDEGLRGGIQQGSLVIVSGHQTCGKTYTTSHIVRKYLEQFPESRGLWLDIENRIQKFHFDHIPLKIKERLDVLRSVKGNVLTAEKFLDHAEKFISDNEECIIVLDSISMLSPENEMNEEVSGQIRASAPKLMAHFLRKIAQNVPIQNAVVIAIAHLTQDTNARNFVLWKEDGGRKLQYAANVKLMCKKHKDIESADKTQKFGKEIEWSVEKNCRGPDGVKIKSYIRYDSGVDEVMELIDYAINFGLVTGKTWYKMDFVTELGYDPDQYKSQGMENLRRDIAENPELLESLKKQVKEFQ
jgi:RecA/RadA recombinase